VATELIKGRGPLRAPRLPPEAERVLDVALGLAGFTVGAAVAAVRTTHRVTEPVTRLLWRPPLVPQQLQPASLAGRLALAGRSDRELLRRRADALLDAWAPVVVAAVVERLDLTRLVEEHVDLDEVVATVDLDAAVRRVDLDAVVDRIDLDAIAAKLDVDAVIERADLDAAVKRVDIDAVISRVDIDAIAATLDIDAIAAKLDIEAVIGRVDLVAIVDEVLEEIDLPAIIRDSTGSIASETVRGVRMTGISADDALTRAVDRALFRRRRPPAPGTAT
jgi:hypothetical protein